MNVQTDYLLIGESGMQPPIPAMKGKHLEQIQELVNGKVEEIDQRIFSARFILYTNKIGISLRMHCNAFATLLLDRYVVGPVVIARVSGGLTIEDMNELVALLRPVNDRLSRMDPTEIDRLCRDVYEKHAALLLNATWRKSEKKQPTPANSISGGFQSLQDHDPTEDYRSTYRQFSVSGLET